MDEGEVKPVKSWVLGRDLLAATCWLRLGGFRRGRMPTRAKPSKQS